MGLVKFIKSLTQAQYTALQDKDADTLYFPSDENKIYLGSRKVSGDGQALIANAVDGNLAAMDAEGQATDAGAAISTTAPASTSTDEEVPTSKAVYDAIAAELAWN